MPSANYNFAGFLKELQLNTDVMYQLYAMLLLSVRCVSSFGVMPPPQKWKLSSPMTSSTVLYPIRCYDKYYQLEELEDRDSCTTELFLRGDGVVEFGETDGPPYKDAEGQWSVPDGTNDFSMTIQRTFSTGCSGTDMGEFKFVLTKLYTGEMTEVGASVAITGKMRTQDGPREGEDLEVGYFNMIDATDERLGKDKIGRMSLSS